MAIIAGGAAFPVSRAGRVELIAHVADALLLGASAWPAVLVLRGLLSTAAPAHAPTSPS
jgi:hypothetical protein